MDQVVRRAQAGETEAFGELVRRTTPLVRSVIASKVSNPDDIDDLTQEVYLRMVRGLPEAGEITNFEGWLATVARNVTTDHHRRRARRATSPVADLDEELADTEVSAEELAELHQLATSVRIGIGRLAPHDAALIAMVSLLGFTPTDVSNALGLSPTAAKVAVHRARKRLRQAMLLEEAAGRPPTPCADFRHLAAVGLLVPAALHTRDCPQCRRGGSRSPA